MVSKQVNHAREIIEAAVAEHTPSHVFAMFSGGYDSLVIAHIASQIEGFTACVHINTGIGIPTTRSYVRDTCEQYGWNLFEYNAKANRKQNGEPEQTYEELVLERGFPGPAQHQKMYDRLKGRSVARLIREHKTERNGRIMLVTGIRQQESLKRMGYTKPTSRIGAQVWVNPIFYWSKADRQEYITEHNLPVNPVVEALCMSGECLCGAFAKKGELQSIKAICLETGEYLENLQRQVTGAGFNWGWEGKPSEFYLKEKEGQQNFLCASCEYKHEADDASVITVTTPLAKTA